MFIRICFYIRDFDDKIHFVSFGKKSYYSKYVGFIQFMFVKGL